VIVLTNRASSVSGKCNGWCKSAGEVLFRLRPLPSALLSRKRESAAQIIVTAEGGESTEFPVALITERRYVLF
jgi:hypothetical protein